MTSNKKFVRDTCRAVLISVRRTLKHIEKETGRKYDIRLHFVQQETDGVQGFSFPGGGLEEGETHLECVFRTTYMEGINLPIDLKPVAPPVIFTPELKKRFGFESDHSTYYYVFVKEEFETVPVTHPEGDVHYVASFDIRTPPLGDDPSAYPVLSLKQQLALHYILMDYDIKCSLNYRRISDANIEDLLHKLLSVFYFLKRNGKSKE